MEVTRVWFQAEAPVCPPYCKQIIEICAHFAFLFQPEQMCFPFTSHVSANLILKKKLLCTNENIQELSDFLLSYYGIALKKWARFMEGIAEIRQPSKYRIILFENLCTSVIMLNLKILIPITNEWMNEWTNLLLHFLKLSVKVTVYRICGTLPAIRHF